MSKAKAKSTAKTVAPKITMEPEYENWHPSDLQKLLREHRKREKAARLDELQENRNRWKLRASIEHIRAHAQALHGAQECGNAELDIDEIRSSLLETMLRAQEGLAYCQAIKPAEQPIVPVRKVS